MTITYHSDFILSSSKKQVRQCEGHLGDIWGTSAGYLQMTSNVAATHCDCSGLTQIPAGRAYDLAFLYIPSSRGQQDGGRKARPHRRAPPHLHSRIMRFNSAFSCSSL